MDKRQLTIIVCIAFWAFLPSFAWSSPTNASNNASLLRVASTTISSDGNLISRNFIVDAPSDGNYYCSFWLLSAMYPNNKFSRFKVKVNGSYVGNIETPRGGWQCATIHGKPCVSLVRGENAISILSEECDVAEVESIMVSKDYNSTAIASDSYEEYAENAMTGITSDDIDQNPANSVASYDAGMNAYLVNTYIPLKYSFFKIYDLREGDVLSIDSKSCNVGHAVDVFYMGSALNNPLDTLYHFKKKHYIPAEEDEMQGLSWKRNSDPAQVEGGKYASLLTIGIPKSGLYMVKLRTLKNKELSVADVSITANRQNGRLSMLLNLGTFEKMPIYYGNVRCEIPANADDYYAMTKCQNLSDIDPMLFVEGNAGGRVVGFNDDADYDAGNAYKLEDSDAFIQQMYKVKTSGLHISNYSSYTPEQVCRVVCKIADSIAPSASFVRKNNVAVEDNRSTDVLKISEDCKNVCIYDLHGNIILQSDDFRTVRTDLVQLKSGIYIVKLSFADRGFEVFKLTIK